jgi:hypothetical protein
VRPERPSAGNACSIASASDITAAALVRLISTTPSRSTSCLYARGMHSDPHIALERADVEATGMVYSSRSGRGPRGAARLR